MNEIMRNNYIVFISSIVYALLVLIGCGDDNPVNDSREEESHDVETILTPLGESEGYFEKGICFTSNNEEKTLTFETNKKWNIAIPTNIEWCTVSSNNGVAGTVSLTIKVTENTFYDERNAVLTLKVGEIEKRIRVTQKQQDALLVSSNRFELDKSSHIIDIEVKSNIEYEIIIPSACQSWITQNNKSRSLEKKKISFSIASSDEYDKREGEIIFQSKDISETVHIYQTGGGILILSPNEYSVSEKGGTIRVEIKSNFNFDVQMPDVDWIEPTTKTRKIATNTIYYTISPNETCDDREAEIIFFNKERPIKYEILKIIQTGIKSVSIHLVDAGTLVNVLGNKINKITSLSISGTINASDIISIRKMKQLEELNLEDVSIVGGGSYYTHSETYPLENIQYYAKDNTIGGYMFAGLYNLKRITLPKNTISIEPYAFNICTALEEIIISKENTYFVVDNGILYDSGRKKLICYPSSLSMQLLNIPESIVQIYSGAFYGCKKLYAIDLSNVKSIGAGAFRHCESLNSIEIPHGVQNIAAHTFRSCQLKKIIIPSSVSEVSPFSFFFTGSLREIYIESSTPPRADMYNGYNVIFENRVLNEGVLYVPQGSFTEYWKGDIWGLFKNIVEK